MSRLVAERSAGGEAGELVDPSSLWASAPWTGSGLQVVTRLYREGNVLGAPQVRLLWGLCF